MTPAELEQFSRFRARYLRQPHEVSLETLAQCNAACSFCPYPTLERKGVELHTDVVLSLLKQMTSWREPFFLAPFKVNEPLLDSRLEYFCDFVERHVPMARLRLFTNGSPLVAGAVEWIGRLKRVEHLWISLNETDPEKYYRLMQMPFARTQRRLDELHERALNCQFPHNVIVSAVADDDPAHAQRFMEYVITRWPLFHPFVIKRDGWLGYVDPANPAVPQAPCGRWFELSIMSTGKVALCCMDGTGEFSIGDVSTHSLLEIYNQPGLLARRESASDRKGIAPCERCTY